MCFFETSQLVARKRRLSLPRSTTVGLTANSTFPFGARSSVKLTVVRERGSWLVTLSREQPSRPVELTVYVAIEAPLSSAVSSASRRGNSSRSQLCWPRGNIDPSLIDPGVSAFRTGGKTHPDMQGCPPCILLILPNFQSLSSTKDITLCNFWGSAFIPEFSFYKLQKNNCRRQMF